METFELCKKLYELKPDWQPITACRYTVKFKASGPRIYPEDVNRPCYDWVPEYTLEYLLDKLPNTIDNGSDFDFGFGTLVLSTRQGQHKNDWLAFYKDDDGYTLDNLACAEQTPLDAVLKLAIIMAEKGLV